MINADDGFRRLGMTIRGSGYRMAGLFGAFGTRFLLEEADVEEETTRLFRDCAGGAGG